MYCIEVRYPEVGKATLYDCSFSCLDGHVDNFSLECHQKQNRESPDLKGENKIYSSHP